MLISAQGETRETPEGGPPSKEEANFENLQDGAFCRTPHPPSGGMSWDYSSFTLLGRLEPWRSLNSIQKTIRDSSDILSGETEVDHPLCVDCTDYLPSPLCPGLQGPSGEPGSTGGVGEAPREGFQIQMQVFTRPHKTYLHVQTQLK